MAMVALFFFCVETGSDVRVETGPCGDRFTTKFDRPELFPPFLLLAARNTSGGGVVRASRSRGGGAVGLSLAARDTFGGSPSGEQC